MNILIVDDDPRIRTLLSEFIQTLGHDFKTAANGIEALAEFESGSFDLVLLDLFLPGMDGIEVLKAVKQSDRFSEVIMITAYGSIPSGVKALSLGAYAYIRKPFDMVDLEHSIIRVEEVIELRKACQMLSQERLKSYHLDSLLAYSARMKKLKSTIEKLIESSENVLISGGPGVGKNFVAQIMHYNSHFSNTSMIWLNPANVISMLETGTFKYSDSAVIRADDFRYSLVQQGCGAVVFQRLADLTSENQDELAKILLKDSRKIYSNGQQKFCRIYALVETASNRNSSKKMIQPDLLKQFRKSLHLPLLRERTEDIMPLAQLLLQEIANDSAHRPLQLARAVQEFMRMYTWPGNIKEMKSLINHIVSTTTSRMINISDLRRVHSEFRIDKPEELLSLDNLLTLAEKQTISQIFSTPRQGAN